MRTILALLLLAGCGKRQDKFGQENRIDIGKCVSPFKKSPVDLMPYSDWMLEGNERWLDYYDQGKRHARLDYEWFQPEAR